MKTKENRINGKKKKKEEKENHQVIGKRDEMPRARQVPGVCFYLVISSTRTVQRGKTKEKEGGSNYDYRSSHQIIKTTEYPDRICRPTTKNSALSLSLPLRVQLDRVILSLLWSADILKQQQQQTTSRRTV